MKYEPPKIEKREKVVALLVPPSIPKVLPPLPPPPD